MKSSNSNRKMITIYSIILMIKVINCEYIFKLVANIFINALYNQFLYSLNVLIIELMLGVFGVWGPQNPKTHTKSTIQFDFIGLQPQLSLLSFLISNHLPQLFFLYFLHL